jgi:predicted NAD/FAD-binding protein
MKIAVVGSGISGLTSAYLLAKRHDVHIFEAGDYIGGHTHTVDVEVASGRYAIDTGFIVFNDWTYPNFIKLMSQLKVGSQTTSMSFSVKDQRSGLEYNGTDLNGLFAQRKNLLSPKFLFMVRDILRFGKEAPKVLDEKPSSESLKSYLDRNGYSEQFKNLYIIPMGAAIWSASTRQMEEFPIQYFVRFFKNHGMLSVNHRPQWRVISGGSRSYIDPLTRDFRDRIHLNSPVGRIHRKDGKVRLMISENGVLREAIFDEVILASHSNQSLKLLSDPTPEEIKLLSAFSYQPNFTTLHTDINVLPKRKRAWAAWNYFVPSESRETVAVTYNMNILQSLPSPETFCVSLNLQDKIDPKKVLRTFQYDHPVYTHEAVESQKNWGLISGKNNTHFCGAYWGFGFHEDGVKSGLKVAETFGEKL